MLIGRSNSMMIGWNIDSSPLLCISLTSKQLPPLLLNQPQGLLWQHMSRSMGKQQSHPKTMAFHLSPDQGITVVLRYRMLSSERQA